MRLLVKDIEANALVADQEAATLQDFVDGYFAPDAETYPPFSDESRSVMREGEHPGSCYMVFRGYAQLPALTEANGADPAMLELVRIGCDPLLFVRGEPVSAGNLPGQPPVRKKRPY